MNAVFPQFKQFDYFAALVIGEDMFVSASRNLVEFFEQPNIGADSSLSDVQPMASTLQLLDIGVICSPFQHGILIR